MTSVPAVSVIVPNYNHARFLPRRIESILAQTFGDIEVIILDDASTDASREVIARYLGDRRVSFLPSDQNSGSPFAQWNRGVAQARAERIWIAESDDCAEPTFLAALVPLLAAYPRAGLVYCQSWRIDENDVIQGDFHDHTADLDSHRWHKFFVNDGRDECRRYLLWKNTVPNASAVLFRRDLYHRCGGAPARLQLGGDWLTWVKILMRSDVVFTPERLNYFRHHASTARARSSWRTFFDERWVVQRHLIRSGLVARADTKLIAATVADEYLSRLRLAPHREVWREARDGWRAFWPAIVHAPAVVVGRFLLRLLRKLKLHS